MGGCDAVMKSPGLVFRLSGNTHLDPVCLRDWGKGLNEGPIACRTILDLMGDRMQ
jgi:hypothetical protein